MSFTKILSLFHKVFVGGRNANPPSDRRALFDKALHLQEEKGGTAGAEYLFGADGLDPVYWGVSKQQLEDFGVEVLEAIRKGEIRGQPDRNKQHYYPQERFDDPAIGPNLS